MVWPVSRPNTIFFGIAEGKVWIGQTNNNKSNSLYAHESYVVSIAASPNGVNICSGHLDGTIFTFNVDTKAK